MRSEGTIFDYLADSFWASLPERTAEDLAECERKALNWIKGTVSSLIDQELNALERHLENARRMRQSYASGRSSSADNPPNPA